MLITKHRRRYRFYRTVLSLVLYPFELVRLPFIVLAYPNKLLCRIGKAMVNRIYRLKFFEEGMCGGCAKFGNHNRCRQHVKNPYATLGKDCYDNH